MNNIKIYSDEKNATTTLILRQVYETISSQVEGVSICNDNTENGEKSILISSIVIPLVVGVSSTLIYDLIKIGVSRIMKAKSTTQPQVVYLKVEDESGKVTTIKIGE